MSERSHHLVVERMAVAARSAAYVAGDPLSWIAALQGPIGEAVRDPTWLAPPFQRVQGQGTYYLLWRDPETDVSLIAMVLGPRDETPIHDHLTWGVVGVYSGSHRDTRYVWRSGSLRETCASTREVGSVTYLLPPHEDIHSIRNDSDRVAISVFFMGSNLGCRERHLYTETGEVAPVLSGYANANCPGQTRSPFFVSQFM